MNETSSEERQWNSIDFDQGNTRSNHVKLLDAYNAKSTAKKEPATEEKRLKLVEISNDGPMHFQLPPDATKDGTIQ